LLDLSGLTGTHENGRQENLGAICIHWNNFSYNNGFVDDT